MPLTLGVSGPLTTAAELAISSKSVYRAYFYIFGFNLIASHLFCSDSNLPDFACIIATHRSRDNPKMIFILINSKLKIYLIHGTAKKLREKWYRGWKSISYRNAMKDWTKGWTQITCLVVTTLTITLECFMCLCEAVIESHAWVILFNLPSSSCSIRPIHPIGRKCLQFEKKRMVNVQWRKAFW